MIFESGCEIFRVSFFHYIFALTMTAKLVCLDNFSGRRAHNVHGDHDTQTDRASKVFPYHIVLLISEIDIGN